MSFRGRLLLFFMIIVVVPMVAVAVALFIITEDSETGKADAEIAQGLRASFAVADTARAQARPAVDRVAADPALAAAIDEGDRAQVTSRLRQLLAREEGVDLIAVYRPDRRPLASAGSRSAVSPAVVEISTRDGRKLGLVAVSVTEARDYVREVGRTTGLDARLVAGDRVLASTLRDDRDASTRSGDVELDDRHYRVRFAELKEPVGPTLRVGLFKEGGDLDSAVGDQRLLIGSILVAFLLFAVLSSTYVVRELQRQIDQFLGAARRLARGDFSRPVPAEGGDEFAALGTEFNRMSEQLASKIDEVERKRAELEETIRRVGEAFATGLDREGIVNLAVRTAVEACGADVGRALPIDPRKMRASQVGKVTTAMEPALEAAERQAFTIRAEDGKQWIAALEAGEDEPVDQGRPVRVEVDGVHALAVPLSARLGRGRSVEQVGAISIARAGDEFDDSEFELFSYLTAQAAVSIENVDLHETVRLQAVTDELTGLENLRQFHETLGGEIERSRRFGTDVGLIMLDIDDFKHVNDTHGHQQGDLVLIEVGRVLRTLSRDIDHPARIGGEEMVVILPQTGVSGAELLAERMRRAIEDLAVDRLDGDGTIHVTASFGVAAIPACARDKDSLIAEADAALYRAKRAGKNRVARGEPVTAEG